MIEGPHDGDHVPAASTGSVITRRVFLRSIGLAVVAAACARPDAEPRVPSVAPTTGAAPRAAGSSAPATTRPSATTTTPTATATTSPPPTSTTPATTHPPTTTTTTATPTTTTSPPTTATPAATLTINPRSAWDASQPVEPRLVPHSGPLRYLTVHHAGDQSGVTGPERFRSWQAFHIDDRGWGDLAYHFIIGIDGTVYAARDIAYRGDTATTYDPDTHFLVVVEGNFDSGAPTESQLERLPVLLAWAAASFAIPTGGIGGHLDYAVTTCPGAELYPYVRDGLRADVDALIAAGGVALR